MKTITYGIFAEDAANRIFMKNAIPQFVEHFDKSGDVVFQHEGNFTEFVRPNNGEDTRNRFVGAANFGFTNCGLDLCLVGFDCDDSNFEDLRLETLEHCKNSGLENKVLIFIPVQAIEYWLWYIKVKQQNPNELATDSIESLNRGDMKQKVYEKSRRKCGNKVTNPIVNSLSKSFNIDWLRQCSDSFDAFVNEFETYINKL